MLKVSLPVDFPTKSSVSKPLPPLTLSSPSPGFQTNKSLPAPRNAWSKVPETFGPPTTVSSPRPPLRMSAPAPPLRVSLPLPPSRVSSAAVPSMMLSPFKIAMVIVLQRFGRRRDGPADWLRETGPEWALADQ